MTMTKRKSVYLVTRLNKEAGTSYHTAVKTRELASAYIENCKIMDRKINSNTTYVVEEIPWKSR
jgi:hypothetical protein